MIITSAQWFPRFINRFEISLCRKMYCTQNDPQNLSYPIAKFHSKMLRTRRRGIYQMKDITNMDQTLIFFVMDNKKTYADKRGSEVWCATHGSGFDKTQCSLQLKFFPDGKPRVKPPVIFGGKGLRIKSK